MRTDLLDAFQRSDAVVGILGKQTFDQGLDFFGDIGRFRELGLRIQDRKEDVFLFGGVKGRFAKQEFIQ
jgi:hypothetical protein